MRLVKLDQITGEEVLARPIMTSDYKELLSEGTHVRPNIVHKLLSMGVTEIYIKDDSLDPQIKRILKEDINKLCKKKIEDIISKHTYRSNVDMKEIMNTAEDIIDNVASDDNVAKQIYDIRERSTDLYEHSVSTCSIATLIALKMNLPRNDIKEMSVGCLLHDLGLRYVTVSYENTDINDEEYLKHPIYGYSAIRAEEWLSKISKEIILMHHETIDGLGYPLHAHDMMITTKIVSLCDVFDEMICGLGHTRKKVHEVIEYIKNNKGIKYDSDVVDELLEFVAVYPAGDQVILSTGERAIVITQNKGYPERPVVQIITDSNGNILNRIEMRNLLEYSNVFIEKEIN